MLAILLSACTVGIVDVPTEPVEPTTPVATGGPPTDLPSPVTPDPNATVTVTYAAWQEHRGCWGIRHVERPASVWQPWVDNSCDYSIERQRTYWMADDGGHCGHWAQSLTHGACEIADTTGWFSTCDPGVHPCCGAAPLKDTGIGSGVPLCSPNPDYEPPP